MNRRRSAKVPTAVLASRERRRNPRRDSSLDCACNLICLKILFHLRHFRALGLFFSLLFEYCDGLTGSPFIFHFSSWPSPLICQSLDLLVAYTPLFFSGSLAVDTAAVRFLEELDLRQRSISIHFADRLFVSSRWFSRSTSSTLLLRLRLASTSLRPLCLLPVPSSWTSSAPAASPSPPSSPMPRLSSSAPAARPSFASPPVARPDSLRAAPSGGSKCHITMQPKPER